MKYQTQNVIDNTDLGVTNITVRFFIYDTHDGELEEFECDETTFLETPGSISYERHTVFQNGCNQICLTKDPYNA